MSDDPVSLRVLREQGPLTLRELTRQTAMKLKLGTILYDDVDAVMRQAENLGRAKIATLAPDWRDHTWEYVK